MSHRHGQDAARASHAGTTSDSPHAACAAPSHRPNGAIATSATCYTIRARDASVSRNAVVAGRDAAGPERYTVRPIHGDWKNRGGGAKRSGMASNGSRGVRPAVRRTEPRTEPTDEPPGSPTRQLACATPAQPSHPSGSWSSPPRPLEHRGGVAPQGRSIAMSPCPVCQRAKRGMVPQLHAANGTCGATHAPCPNPLSNADSAS